MNLIEEHTQSLVELEQQLA